MLWVHRRLSLYILDTPLNVGLVFYNEPIYYEKFRSAPNDIFLWLNRLSTMPYFELTKICNVPIYVDFHFCLSFFLSISLLFYYVDFLAFPQLCSSKSFPLPKGESNWQIKTNPSYRLRSSPRGADKTMVILKFSK